MQLETVTKDRTPMDATRRERIAEVWAMIERTGAWKTLWRLGRFGAFLPGPRAATSGEPLSAEEMEAALTMEQITFELGTPRGESAYHGIPVLCEGEQFAVLNPP